MVVPPAKVNSFRIYVYFPFDISVFNSISHTYIYLVYYFLISVISVLIGRPQM